MTNKDKYRKFCETEDNLLIFQKDWWLDSVCEWNVVIIEKNNKIVAALPYVLEKQALFKLITLPSLTQRMVLYIRYPKNQKYETKLSYEKKIMNQLLEQLPPYDVFNMNFHYTLKNWLPFYWNGFQQTTRYSYVLESLSDVDKLWANMNNKNRTDIRNAQKNIHIEVKDNIRLFYETVSQTFQRKNINIPYSFNTLNKMYEASKVNNSVRLFFAYDSEKIIHSAIMIVWDNEYAYYILGGSDTKLRTSNANTLLLWEAIKFSSTVTKRFDFMGSMIEPLEKYFRSFGGTQEDYLQIFKTNSTLWRIKSFVMKLSRKFY